MGARLRMPCRALAAVLAMWAAGALAAGFQVNPVRLELGPEHPSAVLTLSNPSQEKILVQAEAFAWQQTGGEDQLQPSSALILNPPIFELPAGGRQLLRVGLRQPPKPGVEQTYRLWLSELPPGADETAAAPADRPQQAVKLLLRVSLPVFAVGRGTPPSRPVWQRPAEGQLKLSNFGQRHLQLLSLRVTDGQGASLDLPPRYVLAGSDNLWQLPSDWYGRSLHIEADSDAGPLRARLDAPAALRP